MTRRWKYRGITDHENCEIYYIHVINGIKGYKGRVGLYDLLKGKDT